MGLSINLEYLLIVLLQFWSAIMWIFWSIHRHGCSVWVLLNKIVQFLSICHLDHTTWVSNCLFLEFRGTGPIFEKGVTEFCFVLNLKLFLQILPIPQKPRSQFPRINDILKMKFCVCGCVQLVWFFVGGFDLSIHGVVHLKALVVPLLSRILNTLKQMLRIKIRKWAHCRIFLQSVILGQHAPVLLLYLGSFMVFVAHEFLINTSTLLRSKVQMSHTSGSLGKIIRLLRLCWFNIGWVVHIAGVEGLLS